MCVHCYDKFSLPCIYIYIYTCLNHSQLEDQYLQLHRCLQFFISVHDRIRTLNDLLDAIDSPSTFPSTAVSYCEINTSQVMAASKILSHHSSLRGQTDTHLSGVECPEVGANGGHFWVSPQPERAGQQDTVFFNHEMHSTTHGDLKKTRPLNSLILRCLNLKLGFSTDSQPFKN